MLGVQKLAEVNHVVCERVATTDSACVAIRKEVLLIEAFEAMRDTSNGHVHKPRELEGFRHIPANQLNTDTNVGCLLQAFQ